MRGSQQYPCLQLFYGLSERFHRTPLTYPSAVLTPLSPILEFQRKVLLGIAEWNKLLAWQPGRIHHEQAYPDSCKSLDELEERLNDDEEYRAFACSCTFLLVVSLYIFKECFQDREHVIFYIFWRGDFFRVFCPRGRSNLPNGVEWGRYLLTSLLTWIVSSHFLCSFDKLINWLRISA